MPSIIEELKPFLGEDGYLSDSNAPISGTSNEEGSIFGAYEGTMLRSMVDMGQPSYINFFLGNKLKSLIKKNSPESIVVFEEKFSKYTAITIIDALLSVLHKKVEVEKARDFSRTLAKGTEKVEILKMAIALLGEYGTEEDLPLLKMLGSHEEFALYATVALKNICQRSEKPWNDIILDICAHTSGWGKIAAICELDFDLQESRTYVLKYGCKNNIAYSYLSNICAIKGKMKSYLQSAVDGTAEFDEDMLEGICNIWEGLADTEHPANDGLADYPDYIESYSLFKDLTSKTAFADTERVKKIIELVRGIPG